MGSSPWGPKGSDNTDVASNACMNWVFKLFSVCLFVFYNKAELLIAKFRLTLKKIEKTTRPFRYNLNKIPYDYTVEVMNRFKGLDSVHRVPE